MIFLDGEQLEHELALRGGAIVYRRAGLADEVAIEGKPGPLLPQVAAALPWIAELICAVLAMEREQRAAVLELRARVEALAVVCDRCHHPIKGRDVHEEAYTGQVAVTVRCPGCCIELGRALLSSVDEHWLRGTVQRDVFAGAPWGVLRACYPDLSALLRAVAGVVSAQKNLHEDARVPGHLALAVEQLSAAVRVAP